MPKAQSSAKSEVRKTRKASAATTEKVVKGTKKRAAVKDPNAPKRPLSAFMFFCKDWRERVKSENPEASFADQGKLLGAKWKELDNEEKKPYAKAAAADKERYEVAKEKYKTNDSAEAPAAAGSGGEEED